MPNLNLFPHPLTGTPYGTALDLCLILGALVLLASVITREWLARKGGYQPGGEDYRWAVVRERITPAAFQGLNIPSTRLTESISAGKYPEYRDYQGSTPMLVPWPRLGGAT